MGEQYIVEFKGFTKEEIEEIIRARFGNFQLEEQGDGP